MNYDFSRQAPNRRGQQQNQPDPYEVLGLPRDVDIKTIRTRFGVLTRAHHPDRNRRNPNYDPRYYAGICQAYEILSDPRKRAAFDQSSAAGFAMLRSASQEASRQIEPPRGGGSDFQAREKFSSGDNKRFNDAFEKQRKATASDRGYGDAMMGRITEQEAKAGRRQDYAPTNVFGSTSVSGEAFNSRFQAEVKTRRQQRQAAIMERGEGEPEGWFNGASGSDISMFDGVIVEQDINDFSRIEGGATGLQYADYMAGFETITEQLPEDHPYLSSSGDVKKAYNERLSQQSQMPDRGHNRSFAESQAILLQQRDQSLAHEAERNRQMVLKYRDQYASQDLLPASTRGSSADAINKSLAERNFFHH